MSVGVAGINVTEACRDRRPHEWIAQEATDAYYCDQCGLLAFPVERDESPPRVTVNAPKSTARLNKVLALAERDGGFACFYCEHELFDPRNGDFHLAQWWPTLDHLLPRSLGGSNGLDNLVLSCRDCNHKKGDHVRLMADVIVRLRQRNGRLVDDVARAQAYIDQVQWELFDAGLGEMPGRVTVQRRPAKPKPFIRPRPAIRDPEVFVELGERVCANLRSENTGGQHGRVAAVVKRFRVAERPRNNVDHVHRGKNPRGVW